MGDVLHRRGKLYIRWYAADGKRTLKATNCKTEREAHAVLREREAEVQAVRDGRLVQPLGPTEAQKAQRTLTLATLMQHFLGDVEGDPGHAPPRIKNIATYRGDARSAFKVRIGPTLGHRIAVTITSTEVEQLRDKLTKEGRAPATVTQTLAVLSKLYSWGRRAKLIDCANPVMGVERPRASHSIDFLSHEEVGSLLAEAEKLASAKKATHDARVRYPMAATAIYCGLRKGELLGLRWIDVKIDAARIDVERSYKLAPKNGKARHLPMHPSLITIIRQWKKKCPTTPTGLVFPIEAPSGSLLMGEEQDTLGLADLLTAAECHAPADGKPWHMLRHTFASHFVMAGGSLFALQRLLGHASPTMTQRYAHLAPDFMAGEIAKMSFAPPARAKVSDMAEARRKRSAKR